MFLKNLLAYSGVHILSQVLLFGQNFVVRWLLPPAVLGIWSYVGVVQGFMNTFDAGINGAAIRELPFLRGQGKEEEEDRARCTAFWSSFFQGLIFMAAVLTYLFLGWQHRQHKAAFLVAAALVVSASLRDSLIIYLQGAQLYLPLSKVLFYTGLLQTLVICTATYLGGLFGLMAGAVLVQAAQVAMLFHSCRTSGLRIRRVWDWPIFKRLLAFGLPLRAVDYPISLFALLDVLVITKFMNVGALAIYTTARLITFSVTDVMGRIAMVIITRLNELGATEDGRRQVNRELRDFLLMEYLLLLPALICLAFVAGSFLIEQFIPRYAEAIPVLQILLLTIFFVPQTSLVRNFWILDKRLVSLGAVNLAGLAGLVAAIFLAVQVNGLNLTSVAWAAVAGNLIYYLGLMFSVGREVWGKVKAISLCATVLFSACYTGLVMSQVQVKSLPEGFFSAFGGACMMMAKGLLLLSPLFLLGAWRLWRSGYGKLTEPLMNSLPFFKKISSTK